MSVTRAARTRYSTPTGQTSQGSATVALDRVRPRRYRGPRSPHRRRAMGRSRRAGGCGRPVLHSDRRSANIRHRFGGHLRAARMRDPSAVHRPCATVRDHRLGGRRGDRASGQRGTGRVRHRIAPEWLRPVIWRRLYETAQGRCARGRQHPGVRGVQLERRIGRSERRGKCRQQRRRRRHEGHGLREQEGHQHDGDPRLLEPPARGHEHPADAPRSSNADQGNDRRPEDRQLHDQVHRASTTRRPPRTATGTATVEQANANKAANDPDAMVYIGTYNSGAAKLSIPILNSACLVMFSPANSYPGLTKAVAGVTTPGEPESYYPNGYRNYARVINTDDVQGAASSEWAFSLGKKKAFVIDDSADLRPGHRPRLGPALRQDRRHGRQRQRRLRELSTRRRPTTAPSPRRSRSSGADVVFIGAITGQGTAEALEGHRGREPGHRRCSVRTA